MTIKEVEQLHRELFIDDTEEIPDGVIDRLT